jgi:hypothetical protein
LGGDGAICYARRDTDWHTSADASEAFYLWIADAGGYRYREPTSVSS